MHRRYVWVLFLVFFSLIRYLLICINVYRMDNAFLVSLVGLRPEKNFWLGLSNQKNIDIFTWTNTELVKFTHWNSGMPGVQIFNISFFRFRDKQQPKDLNLTNVDQNVKVSNKAVLPWQLGLQLDSGICCPAPIRRNTFASTWQRGQFQQFHHRLQLLSSVRMVGINWEQGTCVLRYKHFWMSFVDCSLLVGQPMVHEWFLHWQFLLCLRWYYPMVMGQIHRNQSKGMNFIGEESF